MMLLIVLLLGMMSFVTSEGFDGASEEDALTLDPPGAAEASTAGGEGFHHKVHIWYCASWGSQRNFLQVREWLHQNFPELVGKVTGANKPPPPMVELLLKLLNVIQMGGLLFVVLGRNVFNLVGMAQAPRWYSTVEKNGVQIAIFVYLLLPQILSKYLVTGAFEIELDGNTIFSKLKTGRLPQYADLMEPLVSAGLQAVVNREA